MLNQVWNGAGTHGAEQKRGSGQRPLRHWLRLAVGVALLLTVASVVLGTVCAKPILFVEGGSRKADVIVILGGDPGDRVFQALELYKAGAAPKILISGDGDCLVIRDHFLLAGVNSNALLLEPNSRNTRENAEFSIRLMKEQGMKKAIVVTSWYHTRRALSCFRFYGKGIELSSYPTYDGPDMEHKPGSYEMPHVFREYAAMVWYMMRYGIVPGCRLSAVSVEKSLNAKTAETQNRKEFKAVV